MSLNSYTWHAAAEVFTAADGKRLHPSHGSVFYRKEEIDAELARVAEQRQGEIERLQRAVDFCQRQLKFLRCEIPAEFADIIIKPTTGASNG